MSNTERCRPLSSDPEARLQIADSPELTQQTELLLAVDSDVRVRVVIARRTNSPEILAMLAEDHQQVVRGEVARNPKISAALLRKLSKDRRAEVRGLVLWSENVPQDVVTEAVYDKAPSVRHLIVQIHWNRIDLLHLLLEDNNFEIADDARAAIEGIEKYGLRGGPVDTSDWGPWDGCEPINFRAMPAPDEDQGRP